MASGNEVGRRIALILVLGMLAPFAVGETAFAQGSTGGTIGKTEKSVSGNVDGERPQHKPQRSKVTRPIGTNARQKLFINPTINGVRVDRCWHYGIECDERAATEWCRSKGLARATEWKWEYVPDTVGQSDGRRCPASVACGGFSKISCE
jgi:hypothetical protein